MARQRPQPRRSRLYRLLVSAASVLAFAGLSVDMAASAPPAKAAGPQPPASVETDTRVRHHRHHRDFSDWPGSDEEFPNGPIVPFDGNDHGQGIDEGPSVSEGSPFVMPDPQSPAYEPSGPS